MDHVGPRPSIVTSEDELGEHAAAGWHQSVDISSVAEVSYVKIEVSTCVIHCCTSILSVEGYAKCVCYLLELCVGHARLSKTWGSFHKAIKFLILAYDDRKVRSFSWNRLSL